MAVSRLVTAASSDHARGRRTCAGNPWRWTPGATRNAKARCGISGIARSGRRAETARPLHRTGRGRPHARRRAPTSSRCRPSALLPLPIRSRRWPDGAAPPDKQVNATHCSPGSRRRRPAHPWQLAGGPAIGSGRDWPQPVCRHRRQSCRREQDRRLCRTRRGDRSAYLGPVRWPATSAAGRSFRQAVQRRPPWRRERAQEPDRLLFVPLQRWPCRQQTPRRVASAYAEFDIPTKRVGS